LGQPSFIEKRNNSAIRGNGSDFNKELPTINSKYYKGSQDIASNLNRDKGTSEKLGGDTGYLEMKKPAIHDRLLQRESKSLRPLYTRHNETGLENLGPLYLNHIKQNAIKFTCSENDYHAFLSSNGLMVAHASGSIFLE
jgi:hypothetical protein